MDTIRFCIFFIRYTQSKYTLEKTEETIKNGQTRDTGSIGHIRHRTKLTKHTKNIVQNTKMVAKSDKSLVGDRKNT